MARTLTPTDYFDAAFEQLADEGFLALKQAALCARLGVTTGSFYRHFENWADFKARLLELWMEQQTTSLVTLAESTDDPWERVRLLREQLRTIPRRTEAAIRAWSMADPEVAEFQRRVDDQRVELSTAAMAEVVGDQEQARNWSLAGMYLLIGWESLDRGHPEQLDWALRSLLNEAARQAVAAGRPGPPD